MLSPKKGEKTSSKGAVYPEEDVVQNSVGREGMQDERIVTRRVDLLRTRQVDLDKLMVRHDDLVCLFTSVRMVQD